MTLAEFSNQFGVRFARKRLDCKTLFLETGGRVKHSSAWHPKT